MYVFKEKKEKYYADSRSDLELWQSLVINQNLGMFEVVAQSSWKWIFV